MYRVPSSTSARPRGLWLVGFTIAAIGAVAAIALTWLLGGDVKDAAYICLAMLPACAIHIYAATKRQRKLPTPEERRRSRIQLILVLPLAGLVVVAAALLDGAPGPKITNTTTVLMTSFCTVMPVTLLVEWLSQRQYEQL